MEVSPDGSCKRSHREGRQQGKYAMILYKSLQPMQENAWRNMEDVAYVRGFQGEGRRGRSWEEPSLDLSIPSKVRSWQEMKFKGGNKLDSVLFPCYYKWKSLY